MVEKSLKCCPYRLIFMDCFMPIMNGYRATSEIIKLLKRSKHSYEESQRHLKNPNIRNIVRIPIIALSANNVSALEKKKCKEAGMSRFLSKPPDMIELKAIIEEELRG